MAAMVLGLCAARYALKIKMERILTSSTVFAMHVDLVFCGSEQASTMNHSATGLGGRWL